MATLKNSSEPANPSVIKSVPAMSLHIRESNLIEGIDDPKFDAQGMVAWKFLSQQSHITHYDICKVQKILTLLQDDLRPDERGYYRKVPVWVGGQKLLNHGLLAPLMENWVLDLEKTDPKTAHIRFEKIHPFIDGNGRTGRMLMWWHEIKLGQEPTLVLNDTKQEYYKWFKER